jgi:hypothetical protein
MVSAGTFPRGRLGTLVQKGHPILEARPDLFTVLKLPVDFCWPEQDPPETPLAVISA